WALPWSFFLSCVNSWRSVSLIVSRRHAHDIDQPVHSVVSSRVVVCPLCRSDVLPDSCVETEVGHDGWHLWHPYGFEGIVSCVVLGLYGIVLHRRRFLFVFALCKRPWATGARRLTNRMQRTPRLRLGSMADVRGAGSLIQHLRVAA